VILAIIIKMYIRTLETMGLATACGPHGKKVSLACETNTKLPFDIDFFPQNPKLTYYSFWGQNDYLLFSNNS